MNDKLAAIFMPLLLAGFWCFSVIAAMSSALCFGGGAIALLVLVPMVILSKPIFAVGVAAVFGILCLIASALQRCYSRFTWWPVAAFTSVLLLYAASLTVPWTARTHSVPGDCAV